MEKKPSIACPFLPSSPHDMSYRQLQKAGDEGSSFLFKTALEYTQYLWLRDKPARAILALCRAMYIEPKTLSEDIVQPYRAYAWLLSNYKGDGFLGNPRISFLHQATRVPEFQQLKRRRAWALWYLSIKILPSLPTDPSVPEDPPSEDDLVTFLDRNGLPDEGQEFMATLREAPETETPA